MCGKVTGDLCSTVRHHMVKLCSSVAFHDCHGILVSVDIDGDSRRSRELQGALYAEAAITEAWMQEVARIPMQTNG